MILAIVIIYVVLILIARFWLRTRIRMRRLGWSTAGEKAAMFNFVVFSGAAIIGLIIAVRAIF